MKLFSIYYSANLEKYVFKFSVISDPWCYPGLYCTQMEKLNVSNVTEHRIQTHVQGC